MNTAQAAVDGMKYKATGSKKVDGKAVSLKIANQLSTASLLGLLVKRHKVGLLIASNIIVGLSWALPSWPLMVRDLFR